MIDQFLYYSGIIVAVRGIPCYSSITRVDGTLNLVIPVPLFGKLGFFDPEYIVSQAKSRVK